MRQDRNNNKKAANSIPKNRVAAIYKKTNYHNLLPGKIQIQKWLVD